MSVANPHPSLNPWFPPAPAGAPAPKAIRAVGIVGVGREATGIAHWCATKGLGVILFDPEQGALAQAVSVIREHFKAAEDRGEITHPAAHKAVGGIGISTGLIDLEFCDLIIETHTEDADSKRARFAEFSKVLPKDLLLATSASSTGLEELAAVTAEPGRLVGLGFFEPVHATAQIQVTIGTSTTRTTAERVVGLVTTLGKTPVVHGAARPGA